MTHAALAPTRPTFLEELRTQRWDDHRYYHQSRVNQSLHLVSACCFLASYALVPFRPALAALLGWVVAMCVRQIGHFFFEPRGYDTVNDATFEHKEEIKLGYNLRRKIVLLSVWIAIPFLVYRDSTLFGIMSPVVGTTALLDRIGALWIALGFAGVAGRALWLAVTHSPQTGLVWATKILTDPFHDVKIYHRAPLALLRGEWLDPMTHVHEAR